MKLKTNILFIIVLLCTSISAQTPPPPPPPQPGTPIDGGLSFLLIAGAAYGVYESRKKKK